MEQSLKEQRAEGQGAMQELVRDPSSRKRFLKMVGGAGAAGAFSIFLAACGSDDDEGTTGASTESSGAEATKSDLEIVNYALTLEYLEAEFYAGVIDAGVVTDEKTAEAIKSIKSNEDEHVSALEATAKKLGGKPVAKPKTDFQKVIDAGPEKVLETAASVENLGAAAYLGQADKIKSKEVLASALAIHTVEGRHAALLNFVTGKSITPDGPFAKPAPMNEVLKQVKPFLAEPKSK
ncbi:MAG: ferritin-like domain-containing protein [Thermoleophilaceae bacterium]